MSAVQRIALQAWLFAAAVGVASQLGAQVVNDTASRADRPARVKNADRSSPGKPQAPISVAYRLSAAPAVGVPLIVTITARTDLPAGDIVLDARTDDSVSVSAPVVVSTNASERVWELQATPGSLGALRINVLVTVVGAAGPQARSIVVPIDTEARPPIGAVPADRERISTLPMQESTLSRVFDRKSP